MLSIKKNISFAFLGNITYAFGQYIILIILIKLFPTEEVGYFLFATAFVSPIAQSLDMQLRTLYVTDSKADVGFKEYYFYRNVTNILAFIVIYLAILIYKPEYIVVVILVGLIKIFESQIELIYAVYQKNFRLDLVSYSKIIRSIIIIIVVGGVSIWKKNLNY